MAQTALNLVDTNGAGGIAGLIQTPYTYPVNTGYNYGQANGYLEYGAGTTGSLPFRVDQSGNITAPNFLTQIPNIVFDGDSLTAGAGALPYAIFPDGGDYPSQTVASLPPNGTYYNVGVGGETIATMLANAPAVVDTKLVSGANNIVIICGGSNDIQATDTNPYNIVVAYCNARRAVGWKVIVGTIGPRNDTLDSIPADFDTVRLACNASIRANWTTFADGIADWGNDPIIGVTSPNGPANDLRYYQGDGAHLTTKGYGIRAFYALEALQKLGVTGSYQKNVSPQVGDIWIPASQLYAVKGSPTLGLYGSTFSQAWEMPHGSDTQVMGDFLPPQDWVSYNYAPAYTRTGTATGTIAFAYNYLSMLNIFDGYATNMPAAGTAFVLPDTGLGNVGGLTSTSALLPVTAQTPPAANAVSAPFFGVGYSVNGWYPRMVQKLNIQRTGTDATNDTCTDPVYLFGIYAFRTL